MASEVVEVGDISASPGEYKEGWIDGIELTTNDRVDIPAAVMNGAYEGPTLLLLSLQHGTETQNVGIVHRVVKEAVDPTQLHGQLITIPVANPLAYMHATYRSWIDNEDVGYIGTDNPDGGPTERLANAIWEEAYKQADLVLNMHSNTRPDSLFYTTFTAEKELEADQERMAEAFGYTVIRYEGAADGLGAVSDDELEPTLRNRGAMEGIPMLMTETVDGRWLSEPSQSSGTAGVLNVMKEFDLLDAAPVPGYKLQQEEFGIDIVPCRYTGGSGVNRFVRMLRPDTGGIFYPRKTPGEFIEAGDAVAEVVDLHGNVVEELEMPVDGYIWAYPAASFFNTSGAVQTIESGGKAAYLFEHEDELVRAWD